jgi:uncharacterized membrane protein YagU involved in acid resistance
MCKGRFTHGDINKSRALKNENAWYYLSHYLIGIILAGVYFFLASHFQALRQNIWVTIIYGLITVVFSWCWLLPSIGFGLLARKSAKRSKILRTNLINHVNFGFGLYFWFISFHHIFVQF